MNIEQSRENWIRTWNENPVKSNEVKWNSSSWDVAVSEFSVRPLANGQAHITSRPGCGHRLQRRLCWQGLGCTTTRRTRPPRDTQHHDKPDESGSHSQSHIPVKNVTHPKPHSREISYSHTHLSRNLILDPAIHTSLPQAPHEHSLSHYRSLTPHT